MSDLVTPNWTLGEQIDMDPYSGEMLEVVWRYTERPGIVEGRLAAVEHHVQRVVDANARDGEWRDLVFMPHTETFLHDGVAGNVMLTHRVPVFPSVRLALQWEAVTRRHKALRRRVESVHERVACPNCGVPVGERCVKAVRVQWWGAGTEQLRGLADEANAAERAPLKHPHAERLRADGISER